MTHTAPAAPPSPSHPRAPVTECGAAEWDGRRAPDLLRLERLDRDLFRNSLNQSNANGALFGGQVLAQALTAATASIGDGGNPPGTGPGGTPGGARVVHSLHGYFLRAGNAARPVLYQVERTRDGGRFSTRRVTAIQNGDPIFHMECGFHAPEQGFDHQAPLPPHVPDPDELRTLPELAAAHADALPPFVAERWARTGQPVEVKPVDWKAFLHAPGAEPRRQLWMRLPPGSGAERATCAEQACLLAWLSDYWLAGTAALPHATPMPGPGLFIASLDHAMWFHRPADASQWLLFASDSPSAQAGRGFARGLVHARDGRLVASLAQEALIRQRR